MNTTKIPTMLKSILNTPLFSLIIFGMLFLFPVVHYFVMYAILLAGVAILEYYVNKKEPVPSNTRILIAVISTIVVIIAAIIFGVIETSTAPSAVGMGSLVLIFVLFVFVGIQLFVTTVYVMSLMLGGKKV